MNEQNSTTAAYGRIIDEIRDITATAVAKKQDTAKVNYPKLIEKIKTAAYIGSSICLSIYEMNEYDKKLLEVDGFTVRLIDDPTYNKYTDVRHYNPLQKINEVPKVWQVSW